MIQTKPNQKTFMKRNRSTLQGIALLAILVMPLLLYQAAAASQDVVAGILLGINALLMVVVVIWLT
jgi:hypothetical protein